MKKIYNRSELDTISVYLFDNGQEQTLFRVVCVYPVIDIIILPEGLESFLTVSDLTDGFVAKYNN